MAWIEDRKLRILMIRLRLIRPPPDEFYQGANADRLQQLTASVKTYGVAVPVLLTREPLELFYTLVAGRRRYAAACAAGLELLPAIIVPPRQAAVSRLMDQLHREPPNCFETAQLIQTLLQQNGGDPADFAASIGYSAEQLAEKLRLLTFDDGTIALMRAAGIPQDIANRVLAMPQSERDKLFAGLTNPARDLQERCWILRDRLAIGAAEAPRRTAAVKDVRLFINTLDRAIDLMKQGGVAASSERNDCGGYTEYVVRIPNKTETASYAAAGQ